MECSVSWVTMTFEATDSCKHDGFLFFRWSELLNNSSTIAASGQWQNEGANMLFNTVNRGTHATVIKVEAFFQLLPFYVYSIVVQADILKFHISTEAKQK